MSAGTTKRPRGSKTSVDGMSAEYRLDYAKSRPNRFARRVGEGAVVIVLDPDVAEVFTDSEKVNALLRATIAATAKTRRRKAG